MIFFLGMLRHCWLINWHQPSNFTNFEVIGTNLLIRGFCRILKHYVTGINHVFGYLVVFEVFWVANNWCQPSNLPDFEIFWGSNWHQPSNFTNFGIFWRTGTNHLILRNYLFYGISWYQQLVISINHPIFKNEGILSSFEFIFVGSKLNFFQGFDYNEACTGINHVSREVGGSWN